MKKDQSQSAMKLQLWSSIILGKQKFMLACDLGDCLDDE